MCTECTRVVHAIMRFACVVCVPPHVWGVAERPARGGFHVMVTVYVMCVLYSDSEGSFLLKG